jgi:hypothetical protein
MEGFGKLAIACRVGSRPDGEFFRSWTRLIAGGGLRSGDTILTPVIEMQAHYAANSLIKGFLRSEADSILFIDDDMVFKNEDLDRLRDDQESWKYDGVMGLCQSRQPPHRSLVLKKNPEGDGFLVGGSPDPDSVVEVGIVGLGFTIFKRSLFENNEEPYFYFNKEGDGEDAIFCINAAKNGARFAVNTRVQIGHRFPMIVQWDFEKNGVAYVSSGQEKLMKA